MKDNTFSIEPMDLHCLDQISKTLISDFDDFWNIDTFASELNDVNSKYIVVTCNDIIVGFGGIKTVDNTSDIMNIVVKKDFRGHGISKLILSHLINLAKLSSNTLILDVHEDNLVAISLYKQFGFETIHIRKNYYGHHSALIMRKILK